MVLIIVFHVRKVWASTGEHPTQKTTSPGGVCMYKGAFEPTQEAVLRRESKISRNKKHTFLRGFAESMLPKELES